MYKSRWYLLKVLGAIQIWRIEVAFLLRLLREAFPKVNDFILCSKQEQNKTATVKNVEELLPIKTTFRSKERWCKLPA